MTDVKKLFINDKKFIACPEVFLTLQLVLGLPKLFHADIHLNKVFNFWFAINILWNWFHEKKATESFANS